jgi:DNA polymerase elongation subunit (family B)
MKEAIRIATARGYRVIHVMVDSLFAERAGASLTDFTELLGAIQTGTGLRIKIDAYYDWVILCNNRGDTIGSPARYFGRLKDGTLKVKGLDAVRRDTPGVVRRTQVSALKMLGDTMTPGEFDQVLPRALELFDAAALRVRAGQVDPADWVLTVARGKRAGGTGNGYRGYSGYADAPFVQIIEGDRPYMADLGFQGADREHYVRLLDRAREQLTPADHPPRTGKEAGGPW